MKIWSKDPKDGKESVSLTLLQITFIGCIIGAMFESVGYIKSSGVMSELFYSMVGLYFFRRATIKSKFMDINNESNKKEDKND